MLFIDLIMTFGLGIPLAILAGFLRDSHIWRLLAFISLIVEAALAVFVAGVGGHEILPIGGHESPD
jgi:ABC-type dipeptide/oligopeptide/nickel transport system permease component